MPDFYSQSAGCEPPRFYQIEGSMYPGAELKMTARDL